MSILTKIRQLDAYSKPIEDFRVRTFSGGAVTVLSGVIMVWLFTSELFVYMSTEVVEELFVDSTQSDDKIDVHLDIKFTAMSCALLTVDIMDVTGSHQSDLQHSIWKRRIDKFGNEIEEKAQRQDVNQPSSTTPEPVSGGDNAVVEVTTAKCGSCYGAETPNKRCCNSCDEVRLAYAERQWALSDVEHIEQCKSDSWLKNFDEHKGEGCHIFGTVHVAKVAGNIHIAPGDTLKDRHSHVHNLHNLSPGKFNSSHDIVHLSFGTQYPNKQYPLDGLKVVANEGGIMMQYYLQVVPTLFQYLNQEEQFTYQYSVTKHQKVIVPGFSDGLPGLFVQYEFSPLMVKLQEREKTLTHFLVSVCGIVGGVFTVASLLDMFIYHSSKAFAEKLEIGKAT